MYKIVRVESDHILKLPLQLLELCFWRVCRWGQTHSIVIDLSIMSFGMAKLFSLWDLSLSFETWLTDNQYDKWGPSLSLSLLYINKMIFQKQSFWLNDRTFEWQSTTWDTTCTPSTINSNSPIPYSTGDFVGVRGTQLDQCIFEANYPFLFVMKRNPSILNGITNEEIIFLGCLRS